MGLFDNKKGEKVTSSEVPNVYNFVLSRCKIFEVIKSLVDEADRQYMKGEYQLCDGILSLVSEYIERNKTVGTMVVTHPSEAEFTNDKQENKKY